MNREKQIMKMAKVLCDFDDCGSCVDCEYHNGCIIEDDAKKYYDAGYRKISDVIKEIYEELYEQSYPSAFGGWAISLDMVRYVLNKYESENKE